MNDEQPNSSYDPIDQPAATPPMPAGKPRRMVSRKALIVLWVVLFAAACGLGFTTFKMIESAKIVADKDTKITAQQKEIAILDKKAVAVGSEAPMDSVVKTDEFTVPELGVAFMLPPELKDDTVTYAYSYHQASGTSSVTFSTKALIDRSKACGFDGGLGAIGTLSKRAGQQTGSMASAVVVKQYPSYHLMYAGAQAPCGDLDVSLIPHEQFFEALKASIHEVR